MTEMVSDPVHQVVLQIGVPEEQKWQSVQLEMPMAPHAEMAYSCQDAVLDLNHRGW